MLFVGLLAVALEVGMPLARAASVDGIPAWTWDGAAIASVPTGADGRADVHNALSLLRRWPLGAAGWSIGVGAAAERFTFAADDAARPRRLESVAMPLALEYFRDGESAAGVVVRPGRYVADRARASGWDAPVDAVAGIPLTGAWNGVAGVSAGRFYRRALPIGGLIWEPRRDLRVEALFPEPAIVLKLARVTLRLGGELVGGGFQRDAATPGGRSVEYYAYRVGAGLTLERGETKVTISAGVEPERRFTFAADRPDVCERRAIFLGFDLEFRK